MVYVSKWNEICFTKMNAKPSTLPLPKHLYAWLVVINECDDTCVCLYEDEQKKKKVN